MNDQSANAESDDELKNSQKVKPVKTVKSSANVAVNGHVNGITTMINPEQYSSIGSLIRVTAYVKIFVNNIKTQATQGKLTLSELPDSENLR